MARVKVHIEVVERQVTEVKADLEVMEWKVDGLDTQQGWI
ncbi:hypothetical protein RO3G_07547 [Rhizopus delemar RA 99-880]|uniref:Uncharacterized protein n=1 Tax=Rhizopus delemar (strain RA 99-880 / ATCC MYA-4621 / FGSC 9543 / NRRL 43880) TaxID=246409 RepID=I1C312_RHIO9|nr:hypothetical protein RO3G_07547 [Rhizopus delemar RA 99-880]|eukprot:EIE82842.1 hypothetical protein RO3G_07547 [Rhizopus delemar RA 99-880]